MQYQPSANEKASRAAAQSSQLPNLPPRIHRSQSANDAAAGVYSSYMYGDTSNQDYNKKDARYYSNYSASGAQTYTDTYASYDAHNAYYHHQSAAEQAPTDEAAAYHQYHAQAAMQKAKQQQQHQQQRSQHTLSPIYDSHSHNYSSHYNNPPQQPQQPQPPQPSTHRHYPSHHIHNSPPHHSPSHGIYSSYTQSHVSKQQPTQLHPPIGARTSNKKGDSNKDDHKMSLDSATDDKLPVGPTQLQHAATTGFYIGRHAPPQPASSDLRFELEQIQNAKNAKRVELEIKRKALNTKKLLSQTAMKELDATRKKWNLEREEIIRTYGGKIPSFIIESDKLRKDLENMSNRNSALQASLEVISNHLQTELYELQYQLKIEKEITDQTHEHNIELERRVRELRIEKLELETELTSEQDKLINIKNNTLSFVNDMNNNENSNDKFKEYPPESTVIQNLLQAQVEFYFSDYNLKRDKRLLSDVVKVPKKGFLRLEEVMKLSRIRQLCSEIETLEEALRRSSILTLIREEKRIQIMEEEVKVKEVKDEKEKEEVKEKEKELKKESAYEIWVGRLNFEKPREKEFPFRRTVFIFGIPTESSSEFLHEMLAPFGTVSKIQFDHSPDGIDRKIGIRFLNKPRVYILYYNNNAQTYKDDEMLMGPNREQMIFKTSYNITNKKKSDEVINNIKCHKCSKDKSVSEGFYTTSQWKVIYCAQCAAQLAEDQLNVYYKERNIPQYQHNPRHKWLGLPPNDMQKRKTALVVFASQRQASKCAYVRTRIAYKGAFATHFHHYSKVKKEIVLNESDGIDGKDGGKNKNKNGNKNQKNDKNKSDGKNKSQTNSPNKGFNNRNKNKGNNNRNNRRMRGGNRLHGRGRGGRYNYHNQNNNNQQQMGYMNYAQQQAMYYSGQQPPQQMNVNMKQPKIYRQQSAPTGR